MIKCIIADDEKHCREYLKSIIKVNCSDLEVIEEAENANQAIYLINKLNPDLLFCDIQMPGNDGFSILENVSVLKNDQLKVIFTTAHDQYAIKALRYAAIDYLLKPVNPEELTAAIARYKLIKSEKEDYKKNLDLIRYINKTKKFDKICLPSRNGMVFIKLDDIEYIEAQGSYSLVHIENEKSICVSKPIISFENLLPHDNFIRLHRSYLVNIEKIKTFNTLDNTVLLNNNNKVNVSVRKKTDLQNALSRYQQPL